ncbi:PKD-like family lipoprotein [Chitinophaga sp.]|uniref:PKD-like family lipoprotein n=1 Tax=Chitinophaga sp. TaxID=1869181 RepID=UPI0026221484|nr:PKD-like family lipoprotein [uncultured Chitinophaga sp.]
MKKTAFILLIAATLSGCYKDLGNYEYKDVGDIEISNIEEQYARLQRDTLRISPELSFSTPVAESDLEFEWMCIQSLSTDESGKRIIGTSRNLEWEITGATGNYNLFYRVRNKKTGVQYHKLFNLEVQTSTYEGWVILSDVEGLARIDMVSRQTDGADKVFIDISGTSGAPMPALRGPRALSIGSDYVSQVGTVQSLYVLTDDGTQKINANTWQWTPKHDMLREMLAPVPQPFRPVMHQPYGSCFVIVTSDKEMYAMYPQNGIGYGAPVNKLAGTNEPIDPAPFIAIPVFVAPNICMVFDKSRRWFLRLDAASDRGCDTIPTPPNALFSYKIGKDLLWMGYTRFNGGNNIAVMKDPVTKKHFLVRITLAGNTPLFQQDQYLEINESTGDIANAEQFAFGQSLGYLLYSVGSKLYQFDINYNTHKLMADVSPEVITSVKTRPHLKTTEPYATYQQSVVVGSHLPGGTEGSNGKVRIYRMPERNEPFELFREWSGFGKVVDISYRVR